MGGFGGLFRASFKGMKKPVLVASVDGVGTKLKIAFAMGKHDTVGMDLVNHCVNDILTLGAEPLFFLDYIGTGKLEPTVFNQIMKGFATACQKSNCALIGGETAQMPGFYGAGEYDLAGTIVGVVDENKIVDGRNIRIGDAIIGLPSNGLHTNGYSLARKIVFETMKLKPSSRVKGVAGTIGEALLKPHMSYLAPVQALMKKVKVKGMAHITGGGLLDNFPRVLPKTADAVIRKGSWKMPPLFACLQQAANLPDDEAYQVFNMGIGYAIVVAPSDVKQAISITKGTQIGEIRKGRGRVKLV